MTDPSPKSQLCLPYSPNASSDSQINRPLTDVVTQSKNSNSLAGGGGHNPRKPSASKFASAAHVVDLGVGSDPNPEMPLPKSRPRSQHPRTNPLVDHSIDQPG